MNLSRYSAKELNNFRKKSPSSLNGQLFTIYLHCQHILTCLSTLSKYNTQLCQKLLPSLKPIIQLSEFRTQRTAVTISKKSCFIKFRGTLISSTLKTSTFTRTIDSSWRSKPKVIITSAVSLSSKKPSM